MHCKLSFELKRIPVASSLGKVLANQLTAILTTHVNESLHEIKIRLSLIKNFRSDMSKISIVKFEMYHK